MKVHVYVDGACSGNPGPMGVGCLVYVERDGKNSDRQELSEHKGDGTNQRAELLAVSAGLTLASRFGKLHETIVYTDSEYAIGLLSLGWKARANQALVAQVRNECAVFPKLRFVKVKGHSGIVENEWVDAAAKRAIAQGAR